MDGRVVVITGGNTGLGREVAEDLARRGAVVVLGCRDAGKAAAAAAAIRAASGNVNVHTLPLDLASLESVREFAEVVAARLPAWAPGDGAAVDALVCNAGVWVPMDQQRQTADGYEVHFGVNHLGHYLLVRQMGALLSAPESRVVVVSSGLMASGVAAIDSFDVHHGRAAAPGARSHAPTGYVDSKLMNAMFVTELAARQPALGAYAVCPGWCKTELARYVPAQIATKVAVVVFGSMFMRSAWQGAQNILHVVLEDRALLASGRMYRDGRLVEGKEKAKLDSIDSAERKKLWDLSARLVKLV
eukprot:TRINITY_DN32347_c0_g1_i1.p1 TRINITY_DN32347_c0_g1~~TRINITY_DN32347_c0_g1_i1.p1  ORF type:complete len:333 (+),score=79.45 TRINITY_DN32347_c0_g1_i1:94-999(+)